MTPLALELVEAGGLRVTWEDSVVYYSSTVLRAACRCSVCRASARAGELSQPPHERVVGFVHVGAYGLQLRFADGHDRGIFPFAYLRSLHCSEA